MKLLTPLLLLFSITANAQTPDSLAVKEIEQVTVTASRIHHRATGYTFDAEHSPLMHDRTAVQALELLPDLTVGMDKAIKLRDKPVSIVYIDDRQITDMTELQALRAEQIKSIEVRNTAGAAYAATEQSAIIRIRLKHEQGAVWGSVAPGVYATPNGHSEYLSVPLSMKFGRLNLYNYARGAYFQHRVTDLTRAYYLDKDYVLQTENKQWSEQTSVYETLSAVYELSDKHSLGVAGAMYWGRSMSEQNMRSTRSDQEEELPFCYTTTRERWLNATATLNYLYKIDSLGSRLEVKADYRHGTSHNNLNYPARWERRRPIVDRLIARSDYTQYFTDARVLTLGAAWDWGRVRNDSESDDADYSFLFTDRVSSAAAYATFGDKIGAFSYNAELRYQHDRVGYRNADRTAYKHRDYHRLFPSLEFSYEISPKHRLTWEFHRWSSDNPSDADLSPIRTWTSAYSYTVGNEHLAPITGWNLETTYSLRGHWSFSYTLGHGNQIFTAQQPDADNPMVMASTKVNGARWSKHQFYITYKGKLTKWLRLGGWTVPLDFIKREKDGGRHYDSWAALAGLRCEFQCLPTLRVSVDLGAYSGLWKSITEHQNGEYFAWFGVEKSFADGAWQLSLSFRPPGFYNKILATTHRLDGTYRSELRQPRGPRDPYASFNLSWNFNHHRAKALKKVEGLIK